MEPQFDKETELIFSCLLEHADQAHPVYLVGGIVRDILLNQPIHDIDLSYCGNVRMYAKKVADSLGASFFMLNEEFQTARIIYQSDSNRKRWIDIVATRENQIEKDLYLRDFTVNSIAIDLSDRNHIIDPFSGAIDLQKKYLKITSPTSIEDDPIRILRAIRLAVQFGWKISPETIRSIRENSEMLATVTNERKRDELFKIFDLPNPAIGLKIMKQLGVFRICFPEFDGSDPVGSLGADAENCFDSLVYLIEKFVEFEEIIVRRKKQSAAMDLLQAEMLINFGGFRDELKDYFQNQIHQDRNLRSITILGMIYASKFAHVRSNENDFSLSKQNNNSLVIKPILPIKKFVLSKNEEKWVSKFVENALSIENLMGDVENLTPQFAFEFFDQAKDSGVAVCLFSLFKQTQKLQFTHSNPTWKKYLLHIRFLLDAYFNHYDEWINPPVFLNGHEVRKITKIHDGKKIGEVLNQLKIKTLNGEINNRQEAVDYLRNCY